MKATAVAGLAGAALVASFGVTVLPPSVLPPGDALRSTWQVMPWVVAALVWIGRRVGARPTWTAWGLLALVVTAPARDGLDLPSADTLWAAALAVLLGAHVIGSMPALRRQLHPSENAAGRSWPDRVFLVLPFAVYLAIQPWAVEHRPTDGDEPYYLLLAHSLTEDRDLDLADEYRDEVARAFAGRELGRQPGDPEGEHGEVYSRHNALLPLVLAPAYALAGRDGAATAMALLSALLAWTVLRLGRRLWPHRPSGAFLVWGLVAFTPPLLIYAHQIWIEVPAALLVALSLDRLLDLHERPSGRPATWLALWLTLLVLLKLRLLLIAVPLALLAALPLFRQPALRRTAWRLVGALAAGLGVILVGNLLRYGNPFKIYSHHEASLLTSPPIDWLRGGLGIFFDSAFGLFPLAPVWMLLLPAVWTLLRRRDAFFTTAAVIAGPYLLALAPRLEWYGGWSPPFRYPMVLLPLFALALVPLVDRRTAGTRLLIAGLGSLTAALALLWLVVPAWTYNLADGGTHLVDRAGGLLGADIGRLMPSMVRWRAASWWWPALSLLVVPAALWRGLPGRRGRARRLAEPLGVGALLLAVAAVPVLGATLPTRLVHGEDTWVTKTGGAANPDRWTPQRPLYRGAWMLPAGQVMRVPVVAGGETLGLRLAARREGPSTRRLEVLADDRLVTTVELPGAPAEAWVEVEVEPFEWPDGAALVLRAPPTPRRPNGGAVVDWIELIWH